MLLVSWMCLAAFEAFVVGGVRLGLGLGVVPLVCVDMGLALAVGGGHDGGVHLNYLTIVRGIVC